MDFFCLTLNLRQALFQSLSAVREFVRFLPTNAFFIRISFGFLTNLGISTDYIFTKPKYYYIYGL